MSAQPAGIPNAQAWPPLHAGSLACIAIMRIEGRAPSDVWAAMIFETRRAWLRMGNDPQGWANSAWESLPPQVQRRLRLSMRTLMAFLTAAGCDLVENG